MKLTVAASIVSLQLTACAADHEHSASSSSFRLITGTTAVSDAHDMKEEGDNGKRATVVSFLSSSSSSKKQKRRNNSNSFIEAIRRRHRDRRLRNLTTSTDGGNSNTDQTTKLCLLSNASTDDSSNFLGILSCGLHQYCVEPKNDHYGSSSHPHNAFGLGYCVDDEKYDQRYQLRRDLQGADAAPVASPIASPVASPVTSIDNMAPVTAPVAAPVPGQPEGGGDISAAPVAEAPVAAPVAGQPEGGGGTAAAPVAEAPVAAPVAGQPEGGGVTAAGPTQPPVGPLVDFPIQVCTEPVLTCTECTSGYDYSATAICESAGLSCSIVPSLCPNENSINACYRTKIDWKVYDYESYDYEICLAVETSLTPIGGSPNETGVPPQIFEYCFGRKVEPGPNATCQFSVNGQLCQACTVIDNVVALANGEIDYGCLAFDCRNIPEINLAAYSCRVNLLESFISEQAYNFLPCTGSGGCSLCGREDGKIQNGGATFMYQGQTLNCAESQLAALVGQNSMMCEGAQQSVSESCGCEFDFPFAAPTTAAPTSPPVIPVAPIQQPTEPPTEVIPSGVNSQSIVPATLRGTLLISFVAREIISWFV